MRFFGLIGLVLLSNLVFGQIRVDQPVQDLGDIFENSGKVTVKFRLENPYLEDTIRIVDITTSCGCTAVLTQDTLIPPRSSISLDVSYDPSGRLGLFVKSVELTTITGRDERNKLFLKIAGNVVAENYTVRNVDRELVSYKVAPIYFYPITAFDTSYLDFGYIGSFINDLTYEIDFYQFTTLGIEVEVAEHADIEKLEFLLNFSRKKVLREFQRRGFPASSVFFDEPVFKKATDLPAWASGSIRLYSVNFDAEELEESLIHVSSTESIRQTKMLLDYQRFSLPEIEEIVKEVNLESIEGKLFLNGSLDLRGTILMPWKKSDKLREKTAKKLRKAIQKQIRETTGATKKEVNISFDSLGIHPDDKFRFILWDQADLEETETIRYEVKPDDITPPLLPTYHQAYQEPVQLDTQSAAFKHFWENCLLNQQAGHTIRILIESSVSTKRKNLDKTNAEFALERGNYIKNTLEDMFFSKTGDSLQVEVRHVVRGPEFELSKRESAFDYEQFDYFTIIPLVHHNPEFKVEKTSPYMVNFDYFFKGIDVGAWGFQRFANYIAATIEKEGFIELRIESSISRIPIDPKKSNLFLAYSRLLESQKRLKRALSKRLVDPNRIIFTDELVLEQGPNYDGTIPVLKYRKFHYVRIVPEKLLKNK